MYLGIGLLVCLGVVLVILAIQDNGEPTADGPPAKDISGRDHDGVTFSLSDPEFRGKVVMVDFWAGWCGPCRGMFPHNKELVEKMKGRPFVLLGVSGDNSFEEFQQVHIGSKLNWRSWWDERPGQKIVRDYGVQYWPTIILIDHNGKIRKRWEGSQSGSVIDAAVEKLVVEAEKAKTS
jgi:thiol-disulfide isomerase/thioredoxin